MFATGIACLAVVRALSSSDAQVRATLESYVKAVVQYDVPELDRLFDQSYLEVSPLGEVDQREKVLGFYRVPADQRGPTPNAYSIDELLVRYPAKDVSVAVFREDIAVGDHKMSFRFTTLLKQSTNGWRLVSNHVNGIRKPN